MILNAENHTFLLTFLNSNQKIIFSTYGNDTVKVAEILSDDQSLAVDKIQMLDHKDNKFKRLSKDKLNTLLSYETELINELKNH